MVRDTSGMKENEGGQEGSDKIFHFRSGGWGRRL